MSGKPFEIGNKAGKGRPAGSRNKKSKLLEILAEFSEALLKKAALMALNGDQVLLRALLDKLIPGAQPPAPRFRLAKNDGELDVKKVLHIVLQQTAAGRLSPQQAVDVAAFVETYTRTVGNKVGPTARPNFVITTKEKAA